MSIQKLKNKKIVLVSTVPYFMVSQLSSQIQSFASLGMQVTIITSSGEELSKLPRDHRIRVITTDIPRKLEVWGDVKALWNLYRILKRESFDILHSFTPKAGLLCAIAGWVARIPLRFHTFTGQPWVTRKGLMRSVMRFSDRLIVQLMRHCYADSRSQCDFLIAEGIGNANELSVMGHGSLGGVDTQRFSSEHWSEKMKYECKKNVGVDKASFIFTYIGRITVDKGISELLDAFEDLKTACPQAHLLLIGPVDDDGKGILERAEKQANVHCLGYQETPECLLSMTDVLCLPSYREGFGTVVIEAAAMGVPCIGTKIPGLIDAIDDGTTGMLVPVKDSEALYKGMCRLMNDENLCKKMGEAARTRVVNLYDAKIVHSEWVSEYVWWMQK